MGCLKQRAGGRQRRARSVVLRGQQRSTQERRLAQPLPLYELRRAISPSPVGCALSQAPGLGVAAPSRGRGLSELADEAGPEHFWEAQHNLESRPAQS